jgi:hypothetical protein
LTNQTLLPFIHHFSVTTLTLADHALLSFSLQVDTPPFPPPPVHGPPRTTFFFEEGDPTSLLPISARGSHLESIFSRLASPDAKYTCLSSAIWEAAFRSYPHHTKSTSPSLKTRSCPMNKWYDNDCKLLHSQLRHAFTHTHSSYPHLKASYRRLLRHKKRLFISQQRRDLSASLICSPKTLWRTFFPHHSPLPLDPKSMFTHTSSLYDVPGQPSIQVTSPPFLAIYSPVGISGRPFG